MQLVKSYSCEKSCKCIQKHTAMKLVVITGGPCAGKTAVLEFVRKILCEHIAILPEAASILFSGGFIRSDTFSTKKTSQKIIYYIQNEMQSLIINEKKWSVGLCDRGTLDGIAYWPNHDTSFFQELNTDKATEYNKYAAVIHLSTAGLANGYNLNNPVRIESASEALEIDERIYTIWKDHPNYTRIDSTLNFLDKIEQAVLNINKFVPECCKNNY